MSSNNSNRSNIVSNSSNVGTSNTIQQGSLKTISDSKLVAFAVGQQKKTRFQKKREDEELKKRRDEEEAAKVYNSFVASFEDKDEHNTFVRGGIVREGTILGGERGEVYKMQPKPLSEIEKLMLEVL